MVFIKSKFMVLFFKLFMLKLVFLNWLIFSQIIYIPEIKDSNLKCLNIWMDIRAEGRFFYYDEFDNIHYLYPKENKLCIKTNFIEIFDGLTNVSYILKKGEYIKIQIDIDKVVIKTKKKKRKIELEYPAQSKKKFESSFLNIPLNTRTPFEEKYIHNTTSRDSILLNNYKSEIEFLKKYQKENLLADEFFINNLYSINCKYLFIRLFASGLDFPKEYINKLINSSKENLNLDDYLFLKDYQSFLRMFLILNKKNFHNKSFIEIVEENYLGKSQNTIRAFLIMNALKKSTFISINEIDLKQLISDFLKNCKDEDQCEYITKTQKFYNADSNQEMVLDINFVEKNIKSIVDGKYTYVDFWASWCGPCILEMQKSKKLKSEYEKKGINFVYISIDDDYKSWLKANTRLGLSVDKTYILPKGKNQLIFNTINLLEIPRYILLDKNGVIVDQNAPRPSSEEIKVVFDNLIFKKNKSSY